MPNLNVPDVISVDLVMIALFAPAVVTLKLSNDTEIGFRVDPKSARQLRDALSGYVAHYDLDPRTPRQLVHRMVEPRPDERDDVLCNFCFKGRSDVTAMYESGSCICSQCVTLLAEMLKEPNSDV